MDFLFGNSNRESCPFNQDIVRCPFLRNIDEPTNFSFSTAIALSMPVSIVLSIIDQNYIGVFFLSSWSCSVQVRDAKGPIFEDGPNFDMAFRLFHGQNGVVPLSERSLIRTEKGSSESRTAHFNSLAAKAATISLSSFGSGGPFGFDAFSEKWKKLKKKPDSSKKESSSKVINYVYKCQYLLFTFSDFDFNC